MEVWDTILLRVPSLSLHVVVNQLLASLAETLSENKVSLNPVFLDAALRTKEILLADETTFTDEG